MLEMPRMCILHRQKHSQQASATTVAAAVRGCSGAQRPQGRIDAQQLLRRAVLLLLLPPLLLLLFAGPARAVGLCA